MTVHLVVSGATRATFTIDYLLTVGNVVASTASTSHACVNRDGRPVRLPAWLKDMVAELP